MRNYKNVNVVCPDCGKSFKVKQFTEIDPRILEKQIKDIERGTLFQEKCPYCHKIHEYPYSFTYKESRSHIKIVCAVNEEDKEDYLDYYDGDEDVRIVDDMDAFNEKRDILRCGYDDRIIEVEKIIVLKGMQERNPAVKTAKYVLTKNESGKYMTVIYGLTGQWILERVPVQTVYKRLEGDISDKLDTYDEQTLIVDQTWAEKFMAYAKIGQNEFNDMEVSVSKEEEDTGIAYFFEHVEELEYSSNEKEAAEYIINNFDRVWDQVLEENGPKPTLNELDEVYDNVINATGDFSMILMNEKKYKECMHVMQRILDTTDLSNDKLSYMNMRRDYMYCIGETEGFDAEVKYLDDWMKEYPEDPYLYGTEIDVWLSNDLEKAHQLALKYVDTPLKDMADEWLLDSCENVAHETKDKELSEKIDKARKTYRRF